MINVTRLLAGRVTQGDALRYGEAERPGGPPRQASVHHRPIMVWNTTRRCNLACVHCYSSSQDTAYPGELTTAEGEAFIDDLASYGIPVLLFSGGEPLMREDLLHLISYAKGKGLRTVISTNGTLLNQIWVNNLKAAGISQIGISIDGIGAGNDRFRGRKGAFEDALHGIRLSLGSGVRTSLRFTMTRLNVGMLDEIFDLVAKEDIPRFCVYHLAYAGRGGKLLSSDLDPIQRREAVDLIFRRTKEFAAEGRNVEVLTVDNHADAAYLYLNVLRDDPERAPEIAGLLRRNGGNSSGRGIANVDNLGNVHPDQFWWSETLGNVRERPFSEIWSDDDVPMLRDLRNRRDLLTGRCADCAFLDMCNGNLRVRAETAYGDPWAPDPACYLTDEEIASVPAAVTV